MNRKQLFGVLAIGMTALGAIAAATREAPADKHRIVFELTSGDEETWNSLLNNVENVRHAFGQDRTEIEVVAHGRALGLLIPPNKRFAPRLHTLAQAGVVFAACENTMRRQNVTKEQLFPFAVPVDSGVAEVVRKQEAGWAYLRIGG